MLRSRLANKNYNVTVLQWCRNTVTQYFPVQQQGFSDSDIQKVTGHASSQMVNAYDKSSRADNASKKVNLIS